MSAGSMRGDKPTMDWRGLEDGLTPTAPATPAEAAFSDATSPPAWLGRRRYSESTSVASSCVLPPVHRCSSVANAMTMASCREAPQDIGTTSHCSRSTGPWSDYEALAKRIERLEAEARDHSGAIDSLKRDNEELKSRVLLWDLHHVKARTKPVSVLRHNAAPTWPREPCLQTVIRLEGFEKLIADCVQPASRNRRFAGKVGWNKLQKTCRDLRHAPVSLDLDPSVRIVPDNFPTIRRAVQNIDKNDKADHGLVLIRPRVEPYTEQIILDRRATLMADPSAKSRPVIHGRINIDEGACGCIVQGLSIMNTNPRDLWGSAIDVSGAKGVVIENCELTSSANDETVLNLRAGCAATVRRNVIRGGEAHGVVGVSIDGASTSAIIDKNQITCLDVAVRLQPSVTATIRGNAISKNQKGVQLNDSGIEDVVEQGGFGRIRLHGNCFTDNRDGHDDTSFLRSLEVLLHPMLRRFSLPSSECSAAEDGDEAESSMVAAAEEASAWFAARQGQEGAEQGDEER